MSGIATLWYALAARSVPATLSVIDHHETPVRLVSRAPFSPYPYDRGSYPRDNVSVRFNGFYQPAYFFENEGRRGYDGVLGDFVGYQANSGRGEYDSAAEH